MPTGPLSPYPALRTWPTSGLTLPWLEWTHADIGASDAQLGPDGTVWVLQMLCYWSDLPQMLQEVLGYSYRDTNGMAPVLRRVLPWQCPWANQLWVKNVSSVKGVLLRGHDLVPGGGVGPGFKINTGPWTIYQYALLTIHFWRPPYYVRTDDDVIINKPYGAGTMAAEWLRYVDKDWKINTEIMSRESQTFVFLGSQGPVSGTLFQGSVGQKLAHTHVSRRWYEIPEECLFTQNVDQTPTGLPARLLFMSTKTTNPVTGYVQDPSAFIDPSTKISNMFPLPGCVNSPIGGGVDDSNQAGRIWGCEMGTLLLVGVEILARPLQLPPYLMGIPNFGLSEPISQNQYDVVFHFDRFDPPRSPEIAADNLTVTPGGAVYNQAIRGHNLAPYSGDGMWYVVQGQNTVFGSADTTTPFQYADFSDLFGTL